MRKIILFLILLVPFICQAYSINLTPNVKKIIELGGSTQDERWTTDSPYLILNSGGAYCYVTATDYFSGTATVKCTYKIWHTNTELTETWEFTCKSSGGGGSSNTSNSGATVSTHLSSPYTVKVGQLITSYVTGTYNGSYKWTTSNPDVLKIKSQRGPSVEVLPVSNGTSDLRVTLDNGNYDEIQVIVTGIEVPVTGISLTPISLTLEEGESTYITETISPSNATNQLVSWSSNDTSVATVESNGKVTAKSAGYATITCTSDYNNSIKATCDITVTSINVAVSSISVSPSSISLIEGESQRITATVSPSDATDSSVTWTSSDNSIATVNDGVVTAISKGTTTITCKANDGSGVSASCQVTVKASVEEGKIVVANSNSLKYRLYPSSSTAVVTTQTGFFTGTVDIAGRIKYEDVVYTVTEISDSAFYNQNLITDVTIPNTIVKIGNAAFRYAESLTYVEIPDNVEEIGRGTFGFCSSMETIYIGKGLKNIGLYPFSGCDALKSFEVSKDNPYFSSVDGILYSENETIVQKVPQTLAEVTLLPSVTTLRNGCFSYSTLIKDIELPEGLQVICAEAFNGCSNLQNITIPDKVTHIYNGAFKDASSIKEITIGESVEGISANVFATGSSYSKVYIRAINPPTIESSSFDNYNATLYVPIGCKSVYATADYWRNFQNIEEYDLSGIDTVCSDTGLSVTSGKGFMKLYANFSSIVNIYNIGGVLVERLSLNAEEAKELTLPAGIYVVNGVKYMVD